MGGIEETGLGEAGKRTAPVIDHDYRGAELRGLRSPSRGRDLAAPRAVSAIDPSGDGRALLAIPECPKRGAVRCADGLPLVVTAPPSAKGEGSRGGRSRQDADHRVRRGRAQSRPFDPWNPADRPLHRARRNRVAVQRSAVAVATGLFPMVVGSDTRGSVRSPAVRRGITGYKSSYDRYSTEGVFPLCHSTDYVGLFAATPADLLFALAGIEGAPISSATMDVSSLRSACGGGCAWSLAPRGAGGRWYGRSASASPPCVNPRATTDTSVRSSRYLACSMRIRCT